MYLIANLAGNINNIETYHVNRDCVEGLATTTVGGKGVRVRCLMARSHVTKSDRFNVT
jgi:predicted ABC-type exoprotein transport system permease subunit